MTEYEFYLTLTAMIITGVWGTMTISYLCNIKKKNKDNEK